MESRKELNSIIDCLDEIAKVGKIFNKERRRVAKACFLQHYKQKAAARGLTAVTGRHKVTRKSVGPRAQAQFCLSLNSELVRPGKTCSRTVRAKSVCR